MNFSDEIVNQTGGNTYFSDMDIKLKSIGYFIKVVECGNISKAAENLYVSQPYLSKNIKALEERLGFDLFIRDRNKLIITSEGTEFYKVAKPFLYSMRKDIENIKAMKVPKINMAVLYTLDFLKMRKNGIVNRDFPLENCSVECLDPFKITQKLNEGLIDTAISTSDYYEFLEGYKTIPIGKINRAIIVSEESELAKKESVSFEDLANKELVVCVEATWNLETSYFMMEKFCSKNGINVSNITFRENLNTSLLSVLSDKNKFFLGQNLIPYNIYEGLVSVPVKDNSYDIVAVTRDNLPKEKIKLIKGCYNKMA